MTYPILYSFRRCPYAMRARMAVAASGVVCELREVVLRDKPPSMLAASPKGTVPVLICAEGQVIDESLSIMFWALERQDPNNWLAADRTETMALIQRNDTDFKRYLDGYKYHARYEDVDPMEHRFEAEKILKDLNERLESSVYLCGDQDTLADYALFPFIRQFAFVDMNWFQASPYPSLVNWFNGILEGPVFPKVMAKYPQWQDGDEVTMFEMEMG